MLGLAPKRLDRVAEWHVVQRYLETLLSLRAEGRAAAHAVLPHKLDSVQPNRQPEFAKGQSLLRGRLQLAALQDRRESIRCERSMLIFQQIRSLRSIVIIRLGPIIRDGKRGREQQACQAAKDGSYTRHCRSG